MIGREAGRLIGEILLARDLPVHTLFLLVAVPPLFVACCVFVLGASQRRQTPTPKKLDQTAPA